MIERNPFIYREGLMHYKFHLSESTSNPLRLLTLFCCLRDSKSWTCEFRSCSLDSSLAISAFRVSTSPKWESSASSFCFSRFYSIERYFLKHGITDKLIRKNGGGTESRADGEVRGWKVIDLIPIIKRKSSNQYCIEIHITDNDDGWR